MFTLTLEITPKRVAGLLCTGFEGGMVGAWCRIMEHRKPSRTKPVPVLDEGFEATRYGTPARAAIVYPSYDYPVQGGATVCRLDDGETADTDDSYKALVLDGEAITRGLKVMAEKYPKHFADFMSDNDDAITGDVFIQCCLLGEIVYG